MSKIIARVQEINNYDVLHIIKFDYSGVILTMMSLEIDASIKIGTKVSLVVKPTHVAIAKKLSGEISFSNKLNSKIICVENGKLLSSVLLDFLGTKIESIITLEASLEMNLQEGENVSLLIQSSELSISEILDD